MTIWLRILIVVALLCVASNNNAQELVKTPVQIPAITPAATAFAVARDRGYYRQEGLDAQLIVMSCFSSSGTRQTLMLAVVICDGASVMKCTGLTCFRIAVPGRLLPRGPACEAQRPH